MDYDDEISLRDLANIVRRGLPMALLVALGAALLTFYLTSRISPTFAATVGILGSQPSNTLQSSFGITLVTAPSLDMRAYGAAATSRPLLRSALEGIGIAPIAESTLQSFERNVSAKAEILSGSSLLRIKVVNADPEMAAEAANKLADALVAWDLSRATDSLETVIQTIGAEIASIDSQISAAADQNLVDSVAALSRLRAERSLQLNAAQALRTSAVGHLSILEPAEAPVSPVAPKPVRSGAIAFLLGLISVYVIVFLRAALDTRFRSVEELTIATGLPVLSEFPRLANESRELPRAASDYLLTALQFATAQDYPKAILVTSSEKGEGKSSVAMALARGYARNDYRTILLDADMRSPQIARQLSVQRIEGSTLADHLRSPASAVRAVQVTEGEVTFDLLPSFESPDDPSELLARSITPLLNSLRQDYDVIIIDTPPALPVADALIIAPHSTGVVFVANMPKTDKRRVAASIDLLERLGVRILGVAATGLEPRTLLNSGVGYGYGYGYGANRKQTREESSEPGHESASPTSLRVRKLAGKGIAFKGQE